MFAELLRAKLGLFCDLSGAQVAALEQHYGLLTRWNKVLNLTAVRSVEEAVERHYCESVFAAIHLPAGPISVADVGSGAGFPGIPIAILRPDCLVTSAQDGVLARSIPGTAERAGHRQACGGRSGEF